MLLKIHTDPTLLTKLRLLLVASAATRPVGQRYVSCRPRRTFSRPTLTTMTHKKKWLLLAPTGLFSIGAGACLVSWAGGLKNQGAPTSDWVLAGTAALVVLNAGVSIFGQSVI